MEPSGWQIFIRGFSTGSVLLKNVQPSDTVKSLKQKFEEKQGIPVDAQVMTYGGRPIKDDNLLTSYGIQSDSSVQIIVRQHYLHSSSSSQHVPELELCSGSQSSVLPFYRFSNQSEPNVAFRHSEVAARYLVQALTGCLVPKLEEALNDGARVSHTTLRNELARALLTSHGKDRAGDMAVPFPPSIRSGETYKTSSNDSKWELRPIQDGTPPEQMLAHDGTFLVSAGLQHFGFTVAVARTYFVNPSAEQESLYRAILNAFNAAKAVLRPGASMAGPREAAELSLRSAGQTKLADMLNQDVGSCMSQSRFSTWWELDRSPDMLLSSHNTTGIIAPNTVYYVSIGFQGVLSAKVPDPPRSNYAIHIADTVLVGAWGEMPQNLTAPAPIAWGNVSYRHRNRDLTGQEPDGTPKPMVQLIDLTFARSPRMDIKDWRSPVETHNSFLSLLAETPALLSACTAYEDPSSGKNAIPQSEHPLKMLRLVSRGGRAVATRAVTSFDVTLNREPGRDLSRMTQLLHGVCLETFSVQVLDKVLMRSSGRRAVVVDEQPSMQAQQLSMFLPAVSSALATVKCLKLSLPNPTAIAPNLPALPHDTAGMPEDPYGLFSLAAMCPSVQRLCILGSPAPALLQLFGSTVTTFDFSGPFMHSATIDKLHELLPCLKSLCISMYTSEVLTPNFPQPFNLSKLTGVEKLQVLGLVMHSDDVWTSLPPNLKDLACLKMTQAPPSTASLNKLQTLYVHYATFTLKTLAGVLRSAPALQHVQTSGELIQVNSGLKTGTVLDESAIADLAADLTLVNSRQAGSVLASRLAITFDDCEDLLRVLLSRAVPVLSAFSQVHLDWVSVHTTTELLGLLGRVFPNVDSLVMNNSETMNNEMMFALLLMRKLKQLSMRGCPLVTGQGLTFLCCQMPTLQVLSCLDCEGVSNEQALLLGAMMTAVGKEFSIEVQET